MDIHSWSRPDELRVRHLELDLDVNPGAKLLDGSALLHFDPASSPELILDTRDLVIHGVDNALGFELGAPDPILELTLPPG